MGMRQGLATVGVVCALLVPRPAPACLIDFVVDANSPGAFYLFPNWTRAQVAIFDAVYCDSTICAWSLTAYQASITGLTIMNYGTATGGAAGDLTGMYFCGGCTAGCTVPTQTLTYAGIWNVGGTPYPAWTWSSVVPLVFNTDPCNTKGGCATACQVSLPIWVDVNSCPTNNATIALGPGYNPTLDPLNPGGVVDEDDCRQPWASIQDPAPKVIVYTLKTGDLASAAPGDTVNYTVFYGRPGTGSLTQITIMDSLPPFTSYVTGSAVPAPDIAWDPDWGPPVRLRWTLPGPFATAGGPTASVKFQLTVDWGNQPFDPGSGPSAAPENLRLGNRATEIFDGPGACAPNAQTSPSADTVVHRFLMYEDADNDIVFSYALGQPPDEIIYSLFVKNLSPTKTWWNVQIWDTMPAELDPWCVNCGHDDPCLGWTMTPGGCAAASAGKVVVGANTIMTWNLDMPPGMTVQVRWKAQVRPTAPAGNTAVSIVSVQELGFNGVEGTGNSQTPANFTHLAPIFLPTTYVSYTSYFGADKGNTAFPGLYLPFFPLNKKTDFSLYGVEVIGPGTWAELGGVSTPIANFIGTCTGGFTGYQPGGIPGCKIERAPAMYDPPAWHGVTPSFPFHFIYKIISNSPVLWQTRTWALSNNQDHHLYDPSSTVTFRGFTLYTYRMAAAAAGAGLGSAITLINTSTNSTGTYQTGLTTTVHMFKWDPVALAYQYVTTMDLDAESAGVVFMGTSVAEAGFFKALSSQASLIIHHSYNTFDSLAASGCCDNHSTLAPTRETGNVVSQVGSGNFYAIGDPWGSPMAKTGWTAFVVGNTGVVDARYKIWSYQPTGSSPAPVPIMLGGTSGKWIVTTVDTVPAGLFAGSVAPPNPHAYGGGYDNAGFTGPSTALFKVELVSSGPISVYCGTFMPSVFSGGAVMHAADGKQTGLQFWYHQTGDQGYNCGGGPDPVMSPLGTLDVFCPKQNMAIGLVSSDGFTASYTTNAADEVIAFHRLSFIGNNINKRDWRIDVLPGPSQGSVVALYQQCTSSEKGYTSPFVQTGTHYLIVAPPVVYSGQSFWITVVVVDQSNTTKTDYCGTISFTATDPLAKIENGNMDTYNFTWSSTTNCNAAPNEDGVHIFFNVIFNKLGQQTLIGADTVDGTITGFASIMVVGVDVKLTKVPRFVASASGDLVRFQLCWSNYSSASAFTFVITDAIPMGTAFFPEAGTAAFDCGGTLPVNLRVAYSTAASTTPPAAFTEANPIAGTRWLRFTVPQIGINSTGCACYRVTVN